MKKTFIQSISTYVAILSLGILAIVPSTISTFAQSNNGAGIGIVPANQKDQEGLNRAWFINTLKRGESIARKAEIINGFDREATVNIFAKDATQTLDGSFTFIENEAANKQVGSWIQLSKTQVTLPAKSSILVDFNIAVPQDAQAGEYAGAIAVQEAGNPNSDQQGVQLQTRIGARVYLTVAGNLSAAFEVKNLNIMTPDAVKYPEFIKATKHLSFEKMYANFDITNTGNIYSYAQGKMIIEGPDGKTEVPVNKDFAPRSEAVNLLIDLQRNWVIGDYKITFELTATPVVDGNKDGLKNADLKSTVINVSMNQEKLDKMKEDKSAGTGAPSSNATAGTGFAIGQAAKTEETSSNSSTLTIVYSLIGVIVAMALAFAGYLFYTKYVNKKK